MLQTAAPESVPFPGVFRPELFFMGETRGAGVVPLPFGRTQRCSIWTRGWDDEASGAMHFDEVFRFDDGRVDTLHWALEGTGDGRLSASEVSVVGEPRSTLQGPYWRIRFRRLGGGGPAGTALSYDARFHLVAPDTVMKRVSVSLLGVTLGTMSGFHRRLI